MSETMGLLEDRAAIVRLAELWYHADGFTEMAADGRLPDPAPWIEAALVEEHSGDCTKQCWSCMRCHAEDQMKVAEWVYPRARHALALSKRSDV